MTTTLPTWSDRAIEAIRKVSARPWSLFLVLLAVNALARPYAGIVHDARLYSAQVLNQLDPGALSDDLFFRYGSQDEFSIFSRCAAPLVEVLGLEPAFFLIYLIFNSLLILGLKRLVESLIDDRLISTAALVFMMVAPLGYGGLNVFHVLEPFLTPRLLASAFVLFGLERTLPGRYGYALGLILLGMAFHPLMAVGGLLIWASCLGWHVLPGQALVVAVLLLSLGGVCILARPSMALTILGAMDESWREIIVRAAPFACASEWAPGDWLNVAMGLLGVGAAAYTRWGSKVSHGRFLVSATVVSVVSLCGTGLAECLPYALLLQGQPYRALWILKVLQVPFAFWFAARLWRVPQWHGPLGAAALIGFIGSTSNVALEWCFAACALPVVVVCLRGFSPAPRLPDWWGRSLLASVAVGFACWTCCELIALAVNHAFLSEHVDTLVFVRFVAAALGPIPWLLLFALAAVWLERRSRRGGGFQGTVLAGTLLVQAGLGLLPSVPAFRDKYTCYGKDIRCVREFLSRRHAPARPTIYSSLGRLDLVWLDLNAKCYFDWLQMSGVMFTRPMAVEGQRRALVVGPFEVDRFRELGDVPESTRLQASRLFALDFDTAKPDLGNLQRLCAQEDLDFLLLTHEFPGLVAASTGRIFVYDCRQVRAALKLRPPAVACLAP